MKYLALVILMISGCGETRNVCANNEMLFQFDIISGKKCESNDYTSQLFFSNVFEDDKHYYFVDFKLDITPINQKLRGSMSYAHRSFTVQKWYRGSLGGQVLNNIPVFTDTIEVINGKLLVHRKTS